MLFIITNKPDEVHTRSSLLEPYMLQLFSTYGDWIQTHSQDLYLKTVFELKPYPNVEISLFRRDSKVKRTIYRTTLATEDIGLVNSKRYVVGSHWIESEKVGEKVRFTVNFRDAAAVERVFTNG